MSCDNAFGTLQGTGPYNDSIKQTEDDITAAMKKVNELAGTKESDTGLAVPALWDLAADKQALQTEEPLQVYYRKYSQCTHMYMHSQ